MAKATSRYGHGSRPSGRDSVIEGERHRFDDEALASLGIAAIAPVTWLWLLACGLGFWLALASVVLRLV